MYQDYEPDGLNQSVDLAVSPDGAPAVDQLYTIPARCGIAVRVLTLGSSTRAATKSVISGPLPVPTCANICPWHISTQRWGRCFPRLATLWCQIAGGP